MLSVTTQSDQTDELGRQVFTNDGELFKQVETTKLITVNEITRMSRIMTWFFRPSSKQRWALIWSVFGFFCPVELIPSSQESELWTGGYDQYWKPEDDLLLTIISPLPGMHRTFFE